MLLDGLRSRFGRQKPPREATTGGALIYAIGDIHGRSDLLDQLVDMIQDDARVLGHHHRPVLLFIGDYVDRGGDSRGVVDRLLALEKNPELDVRTLKGNHEQQMLAFLDHASEGPPWAEFGGAATLASYGVTPPAPRSDATAWEEARMSFSNAVAGEHLAFFKRLELAVVCGDYLFVHAGVRPGIPLAAQSEQDLLWIREDFLSASEPFERVVVHGHTPELTPYIGRNRIGIDTGAYATATLTAVRLLGTGREVIQTTSPRRQK